MRLAVILVVAVVVAVATLSEASEKIARYVRLMKENILEHPRPTPAYSFASKKGTFSALRSYRRVFGSSAKLPGNETAVSPVRVLQCAQMQSVLS